MAVSTICSNWPRESMRNAYFAYTVDIIIRPSSVDLVLFNIQCRTYDLARNRSKYCRFLPPQSRHGAPGAGLCLCVLVLFVGHGAVSAAAGGGAGFRRPAWRICGL